MKRFKAVAAIILLLQVAIGAQTDTAYVPFVVNTNATVRAMFTDGFLSCGPSIPQISVTSYVQTYLRIPVETNVGVRYGAQKTLTAPAIVSNGAGKVTLNLPAQSYKNAEIALYSVNGKRMLRQKASAANTANSISLPNAAPGAYLLSVKGADGVGFTSRLTHSGGNLGITVAFGGENRPAAARQLAKEAAVTCGWRITVGGATGYADTSYWFNPVSGWSNPVQEIYLRRSSVVTPGDSGTPSGMYSVSVSSEGIGATGSGSYAAGATVSINAGTAPAGQQFKNWTTSSSGVTFYNANSATTTFTMPANAVTVAAVFEASSATPWGPPRDVTVTAVSATSVTLSWTAVSGANNYRVRCEALNSLGDAYLNSQRHDVSPSTTYTVSGLTGDQAYRFIVYACRGTGTECSWQSGTGTDGSPVFATTESLISGTFIDSRDEQVYGYVTVFGKRWMARNLNYQSSGSCYDGQKMYCRDYGALYSWGTAKKICPPGWHLPTRQEWGELAVAAGGTGTYGTGGTAGTTLKSIFWFGISTDVPTDTYGFKARPGGGHLYYNPSFGYYNVDKVGYWWTASASENGGQESYARLMSKEFAYVDERLYDEAVGLSVRCVGD